MSMTLREFAESRRPRACHELLTWLGDRDLQGMWEECHRSDWMLWLLREFGWDDVVTQRRYALWCARQVDHLMDDRSSRECLDVVERYLDGAATGDELVAARAAACDAAWAAAWAASGNAARAAAWDAAWAAARDAAWAAAGNAARAAAWDAAGAAAWDAAWAAAWAAAWDAAGDAVWDAAWAAAMSAQSDKLRELVSYETVAEMFAAQTGGQP